MTVLPLKRLCNAILICSSLKLSSAEVGSSSKMIFGFLSIILAIASLCFCHHDNLTHLSPISVSSPFSNSRINSHFARDITDFMRSCRDKSIICPFSFVLFLWTVC